MKLFLLAAIATFTKAFSAGNTFEFSAMENAKLKEINTCSKEEKFGSLEYVCQKYYFNPDCSGPAAHVVSKKYNGCNPYLFEKMAEGKYYDMQVGGLCLDSACTQCMVSGDPITPDTLVGEENAMCRSRQDLGMGPYPVPTWNFHRGPCPTMCPMIHSMYPNPTQEVLDYAPQCFN